MCQDLMKGSPVVQSKKQYVFPLLSQAFFFSWDKALFVFKNQITDKSLPFLAGSAGINLAKMASIGHFPSAALFCACALTCCISSD
jgi:hypothetical protein